MQGRTGFASRSALAALTVAASAIAIAPAGDATPAETCLKAPHGIAPQGSHWYYRLERTSQRRCWYLAEMGRKSAHRVATRMAPQTEPEEEAEAPSAPVANAPAASTANAPSASTGNASPAPAAEPQPVITTLVTRNVSNMEQVAQSPVAADSAQPPAVPNSAPGLIAEAPAAPLAQAPSERQTSAAVTEQPAPQRAAPADQAESASTQTMPTLQLLLGAIALLGLLASAAFFVIAMVRRRNDVLNTRREAHTLPYEASPEMADDDEPTFRPMRAIDAIRQRDDVDEALQRFARRRRAAAVS